MSEHVKDGAQRAEPERWKESAGRPATLVGAPPPSDPGALARARTLVARVDSPAPRRDARARVFARIEETRRSSSRTKHTWAWALSGAAAGALAVLIAIRVMGPTVLEHETREAPATEPRVAEIVAVEGNVHAGERAQPMAVARVGQRVKSGARVKTNAGSASVVRVPEVGDLELAAETEVLLALGDFDRGRGVEVALQSGALVAEIERVLPARTVAITTGPWTVRVIGTSFRVLRDGAEDIEVDVRSGVVDVDGPETHVRLNAGDHFSSRRARARAEAKEAPKEAPAVVEDAAEEAAAPRHSTRDRVAKTLRAGAAKMESAKMRDEKTVARAPQVAVETPAIEPAAVPLDRTPAREPDATELYETAQRETNPLRAIELFDAVAMKPHALAEIAAHQAARITMRIGKCTDAVARFNRVLAKYPQSAYAQEARLNVLECHIRLGELDLAKRDLETFLAQHPTSERSPELRFLRAELHRGNGDYRAAARDYEAALDSRRDADARYFKGWCQLQTGAITDAKATLQDYLDRYPEGRHAEHARAALKK